MNTFNFSGNISLENKVVLLRPLEISDYETLLPFSLQEPEIWKYSLVAAGSAEMLKQYIQTAVEARIQKNEYPFIVFDKRKNQYAGSTRFYDIQLYHKTLQLGYTWYGKEFQGSGINKHCKFLMLQFAFEEMKFERVEFRADLNNQRSIQAMKSIGCKPEGILRSNTVTHSGKRRDTIVLSILADEWFKEVRDYLSGKLIW